MSLEEYNPERPLYNIPFTIELFLKSLRDAIGNTDIETGYANAVDFYESAYDIGRFMHLYSNYQTMFTEEQKKGF